MVSPIHLLLFGSRKIEYIDNVVRLDNWINLDINPEHAAAIVALRPALESLVVRAAKEPEAILELSPIEEKVNNKYYLKLTKKFVKQVFLLIQNSFLIP